MSFTATDLEIAKSVFQKVVSGDPNRARLLDPVIRWTGHTWDAIADVLAQAGFNRHKPAHLAALQSLIDQACDAK